MKKHAAIMGPKFKAVTETLAREVGPLDLATWHDPKGGYFVSVNTLPGLAKRTLALCKEAGVIMTSAGATFPYGVDPKDSNIRVAPSLPPVEELQQAMEVFCCCLKLAALEQLKEGRKGKRRSAAPSLFCGKAKIGVLTSRPILV